MARGPLHIYYHMYLSSLGVWTEGGALSLLTFVMLKYENLVKLAKNVAIVKSVDATKNPQKLASAVKFLLAAGIVAGIAHSPYVKIALTKANQDAGRASFGTPHRRLSSSYGAPS